MIQFLLIRVKVEFTIMRVDPSKTVESTVKCLHLIKIDSIIWNTLLLFSFVYGVFTKIFQKKENKINEIIKVSVPEEQNPESSKIY